MSFCLLYPRRVSEPLNVFDYEALAASRLGPGAHAYYAGGANDELTLHENVATYRRWHLRPRVLRDVASPTTATTVLGQEVSLPVLVAPVAYQRAAHPDGEVAMALGTRAAGTIMCLSTFATTSPADVAATGVDRWYQLYVMEDRGLTEELVRASGRSSAGRRASSASAHSWSRSTCPSRAGASATSAPAGPSRPTCSCRRSGYGA